MSLPSEINPQLLASTTGYNLQRSVRFRGNSGGLLSRTPSVSGNTSTWTWSSWVKRDIPGDAKVLFAAGGTTTIEFTSDNKLEFFNDVSSNNQRIITTQVFRDPSAWYHIVVSVNLIQSTYQNAIKMYVNGVQITSFSTTTFVKATNTSAVNDSDFDHAIGIPGVLTSYSLPNMYITEVNFTTASEMKLLLDEGNLHLFNICIK